MFNVKSLIYEYKLVKAFKKLFYDENNNLKPEAKMILAYLRDIANAKGYMSSNNEPIYYDAKGVFDANQAAFMIGKRRVFDLIIKHLSLNEIEIFNLISEIDTDDDLIDNLNL